ncbi:YkgJ family cysteine cluster protein [Solibacillus faecavium]|nr:YkgJ family cysteine cluster protein [Solibacillus faecavium]
MMYSFPCTECGACCSSINNIEFLTEYNRDGVCVNLVNNRCTIYESRPLLCRVDAAFDEIFSKNMTREAYYLANALACNELQVAKNIDKKFRIDIDSLKASIRLI